ncbi:uncharacterized protein LOC122028046 isoform X1 [Zingiber officinale]|uniref:uncharacterized protein LOC122028046 isoform X1 n=1 Tax=Zingiber officinale TaxID=94328 RepID=UPI001C4CB8A2|nr:uncharacterized protein LOC122028046 isoform X1 [Zingiber officinale]
MQMSGEVDTNHIVFLRQMDESNAITSATPELLDPQKEGKTNATAKTNCVSTLTPSCNGKRLPHYLMPSQGTCHDLCKAHIKADTICRLTFSNNNENVLSRYLTPSQGSCHDLCKHGHKHEREEAKRRHHFFSRFYSYDQLLNDEYNKSDLMTVKHRRHKSGIMSVRQKPDIQLKKVPKKEESFDMLQLYEEMDLSPEKSVLASNSPDNLTEGSVQAPSSLELNDHEIIVSFDKSAAARVEESMENGTGQHELINTARNKLIAREPERTDIQNEFSFHNDALITGVGESPNRLMSLKSMVSSTAEGKTDPEYERANPSEVFSAEHISTELIGPIPISDDIEPGQCQTSNREEESCNKPIDNKMQIVHRSSESSSGSKLKNHKSKESAKKRTLVELASKEALGMKLKTPRIQKTRPSNVSAPYQASFATTHTQLKSSKLQDKTNKELNKPRNRLKEIGGTGRYKVVRDVSDGPNLVKKNFALKQAINVVKSETDHGHPSITCSVIDFIAPRVINNSISPPSEPNKEVATAVPHMKKKKDLVSSSPPSIYSRGLSGERNQEKEKTTEVADNLDSVAKEVIELLPTPSSTKPQFTRVPSIKLRKNRTVAPSFIMNNQAKARKTFVKGKTIRANDPNPEKIDLNALRQKLRKLKSFPDRKEDHVASGSLTSGGNEPFWVKVVSQTQRTYKDVPKVERSRSQRTSFDSEDKVGPSLRLNFSRGNTTNLQPNSSSPPWLRFRQAKMVGDNQNAKVSIAKSFRNRMKSNAGGPSPPSKSINHVIEETAGKLVESRKSKVKALVGAFETVISLRETPVA